MISEQINFGDDFDKIERVISIVIAGETLIQDSPNYHHRFTLYDPKAGVEFTDLIEIHTIELMKLPTNTDGTALYDWAKFIAAETEEELDMVAERNPQIKQAAVKLRVMSADERARDMLERRIKGGRDLRMREKDAMEKGRAKGLAEGLEKGRTEGLEKGRTEGLEKGRTEGVEKERVNIAANLLKINMPKDQIAEITGLTLVEIEKLTF
jgi:predicted transposase/invertase (TIGR01784 family)